MKSMLIIICILSCIACTTNSQQNVDVNDQIIKLSEDQNFFNYQIIILSLQANIRDKVYDLEALYTSLKQAGSPDICSESARESVKGIRGADLFIENMCKRNQLMTLLKRDYLSVFESSDS